MDFSRMPNLIGVVAGWLWIGLKRIKLNDYIALSIVGFTGSMTNTILVMGSIYFLLAQQYAQAKEVAVTAVFGLIMGNVSVAGITEAVAALILVTAISKPLLAVFKRLEKENFNRNKRKNLNNKG